MGDGSGSLGWSSMYLRWHFAELDMHDYVRVTTASGAQVLHSISNTALHMELSPSKHCGFSKGQGAGVPSTRRTDLAQHGLQTAVGGRSGKCMASRQCCRGWLVECWASMQ